MTKGHTFWNVLVLLLALGLEGCTPTSIPREPTASPPPVERRQIAHNTLNLREYWRKPHICGWGERPLIAVSGRVMCLYRDPASVKDYLRVYDAAKGTFLWQVPGKAGGGYLAADAQRVYLVVMTYEIHAYDLKDGRQLWERQTLPHKGFWLDPVGDELHAQETGYDWTHLILDANTGEILSSDSELADDGFAMVARFPQFNLYISYSLPHLVRGLTLRAVDTATQQTQWEAKDTGFPPLRQPPALVDNVLLIDVQNGIVAFHAQSGKEVWRTRDPNNPGTIFASTSVLVDSSLYALRLDGRLVRLDARTGQEKGYIQFTGIMPDPTKAVANFYYLAADGQMLVVSFDDSQELIALGP